MKKKLVVFDFDKTLTKKDTIFGYYRAVSGDDLLFKLKYPFFLLIAILAKLKIISNNSLKSLGVKFYLKGSKKEELERAGAEYAKTIEPNKIYSNEFQNYKEENVIVISASFEEYLKPFFPDCKIAGSEIAYSENGTCLGLKRNMYGTKKVEWLKEQGFNTVDIFFTDSFSDQPLMEISSTVYLVKNDDKHLLGSENLKRKAYS